MSKIAVMSDVSSESDIQIYIKIHYFKYDKGSWKRYKYLNWLPSNTWYEIETISH